MSNFRKSLVAVAATAGIALGSVVVAGPAQAATTCNKLYANEQNAYAHYKIVEHDYGPHSPKTEAAYDAYERARYAYVAQCK